MVFILVIRGLACIPGSPFLLFLLLPNSILVPWVHRIGEQPGLSRFKAFLTSILARCAFPAVELGT